MRDASIIDWWALEAANDVVQSRRSGRGRRRRGQRCIRLGDVGDQVSKGTKMRSHTESELACFEISCDPVCGAGA